ncbi:hypothetical protein [Erythrobacter sp. JK5]|uniref:hypothetical protein n=1 Tax=Erythrobacter sp. JK5 TaxID=2829500 RepID=UPI001BA75FCD|nr:hypothetical protein [Erythrobacter sp. JK5]QUL37342.1 hypothetical protein KDC96_13380 [Erythrobacter sp. JK5]
MPSSTSSSDGSAAKRALFALAGAFALLNAAALVLWQAIPLTPVSTGRYLAAVDDHLAMLERSKGQEGRVILIGGSGAAFSISAEALGEELGRPVFNGGIQAGIGFRNLMDLYAPHLDPENDLIVLLPELELLAEDARYSATWCDVVYLRKDLKRLIGQPRCLPNVIHRTYEEVRYHLTGNTSVDAVYRRSGFNAVGDLTSHLAIDRPPPDFGEYRLPDITPQELDRFETYVKDELIGRGFDVLYVPAAMPEPACRWREVDAIAAQLSALSTVDAAPPELARFCLPAELFFDGAGHLNREGRVIQTANVRSVLEQAVAGPATN